MIVLLRGIILFFTLLLIFIVGTIILIKYLGWLVGFATSILLFIVLAIITIIIFNKFFDEQITNFDIILPIIIYFICYIPHTL